MKRWVSRMLWVAVTAILLFLAVPVAATAQDHSNTQQVKTSQTQIVCPLEKTGDASFDAFLKNLDECKAMPTKHWWEFWRRSKPAVKTKKIEKEPATVGSLFSIPAARSVVQ